jgi:type VI secretion system protein ImpA
MSSNRKHATHKSVPVGAAVSSSRKDYAQGPTLHDWMAPVDDATPCGADLEYDPEFVVLAAKVAPKAEAHYGNFVGSPEPVNWSDIDRDCRRLMMRSKDMRLAVLFTRCRTRLGGASGLAEGIGLLDAWLEAFPQAIHPQLNAEADRDAALEIRMNALQALTDADGLLADVREIALAKSTATRLQVRDVERAFATPRRGDALAPESVTRQLDDIRAQQPAVMAGFEDSRRNLAAIDAWSREHQGIYAPDLSALTRLLAHVVGWDARPVGAALDDPADQVPSVNGQQSTDDTVSHTASTTREDCTAEAAPVASGRRADTSLADRHAALERIREARRWFEANEPSSPIPVLLRRAEQFVGKRYAEVVRAIPGELLAQWESSEDAN